MSNQQQQLLRVKPHDKLTFRPDHEKKGIPSGTIRLSNKSQFLVAFKIRTTDKKFRGGPSYGILKPGSFCYVEVYVVGQVETPSNRKYGDKVTIEALVASRDDTEESLPTLFKLRAAMVEDYELRVMYDLPLHQQSSNSGRSVAGSSRNAPALQMGSSSDEKTCLLNEIDLHDETLDELQNKYNKNTLSLKRMIKERDDLQLSFYEEARKSQRLAREHVNKFLDEQELLNNVVVVNKNKRLDSWGIELENKEKRLDSWRIELENKEKRLDCWRIELETKAKSLDVLRKELDNPIVTSEELESRNLNEEYIDQD